MGRRLGLALIVAGVIGVSVMLGGMARSYKRTKEIRHTPPYSELKATEKEIYRIECTKLVKLLSSDPNLPQNIPELLAHYNTLVSKREKLEKNPEVSSLKAQEAKEGAYISGFLGGLLLSGISIYFGNLIKKG